MNGIKRVNILSCPFDAISFSESLECIRNAVLNRTHLHILVGNVDMVIKVRNDYDYSQIWWASDLIIADGVPITWSAKLLRTPLKGRVSGTDIVMECSRISAETGCAVALIGGIEAVTQKAALVMEEAYPGSHIIFFPTPFPLDDESNETLVQDISKSGASIVLAALGAPRQERWIQANLDRSGAMVGIGIGSAFDIISGTKPRAPKWMCDHGLEWFYRMMQEPKRLGRRYIIDDSPFLFHLAIEIIRRIIRVERKKI